MILGWCHARPFFLACRVEWPFFVRSGLDKCPEPLSAQPFVVSAVVRINSRPASSRLLSLPRLPANPTGTTGPARILSISPRLPSTTPHCLSRSKCSGGSQLGGKDNLPPAVIYIVHQHKGACWLLVAQPLLKLEERASRLVAYPEALEASNILINAHGESQSNAPGALYIAIEKLENASGGERGLIDLIGQPATYIKHLKHSLQPNRHAKPQGQTKLDHWQCLERATGIIEKYITLREQGSN